MVERLEVHVVYASVVWLAAWLLTSMPRGSATAKYWIWVATSLNFLLPLGALPGRWWPSEVGWFTAPAPHLPSPGSLFLTVWALGALIMLARLAFRRDVAAGPRVEGLLRPRICIPDGIERVLSAEELEAVLAHERLHARRRDNLIGLAHEIALCLLWFHPLVWITANRLALYRELSCDDAVASGDALISALAKIATPADTSLLQATASSFIGQRLQRLQRLSAGPRSRALANVVLAGVFGAILLFGAIGPVAQAAAAYACALTHGLR
jgi:Zn-dependent protease with chaperone function